VEIEVLSASLILVASVCGGLCAVFIARSKSTVNKHSRQRIKDFENDIQYLADTKKQEAKEYRQEILRLKSSVNRIKDGATVTETDMKNSGLGEVIMQLIPNKYRKAASFLVPQVEEAVKKDPAIVERIYEKIKSANTSNKQAQTGAEAQESTAL
jgi:vacuolar-type H+-ATPase subunit I/STV1